MMESLIVSHSEEMVTRDSPSNKRTIMSSSQRSDNEENVPNGINTDERLMKRAKTDSTPAKLSSVRNDEEEKSARDSFDPASEVGTDCDTEVSSVSALRGWLDDFGKQHRDNSIPKSQTISINTSSGNLNGTLNNTSNTLSKSKVDAVAGRETPSGTANTAHHQGTSSSAVANTIVQRLVEPNHDPKRKFTTLRFKPKFKQAQVQATNDGYASVAKLSAWLADDPTSQKKIRHVRKGRNVIAKSRNFEKDLVGVIVEENQISRGSVDDKKKWLKGAFHEEEEGEGLGNLRRTNLLPQYTKSEVGTRELGINLQSLGDRDSFVQEARSEIVLDDASSTMSVSDKKDWLKNAFKKSDSTPGKNPKSTARKASSDIMHCRQESRDDISARAKKKWQERSMARRAMQKSSTKARQSRQQMRNELQKESEYCEARFEDDREKPITEPGFSDTMHEHCGSAESEHRTGPASNSITEGSIVEPESLAAKVEEDVAPIDFRAARELLVQRSKENGGEL